MRAVSQLLSKSQMSAARNGRAKKERLHVKADQSEKETKRQGGDRDSQIMKTN